MAFPLDSDDALWQRVLLAKHVISQVVEVLNGRPLVRQRVHALYASRWGPLLGAPLNGSAGEGDGTEVQGSAAHGEASVEHDERGAAARAELERTRCWRQQWEVKEHTKIYKQRQHHREDSIHGDRI